MSRTNIGVPKDWVSLEPLSSEDGIDCRWSNHAVRSSVVPWYDSSHALSVAHVT